MYTQHLQFFYRLSTMESIYKRVLTFTVLTLFQLSATVTSTSAASTASENCSEKCGNMTIPYPFGIKDGCFRNGFHIYCNETAGTASIGENLDIKDISVSQAQMRIYNWISHSCYSLAVDHYVDFRNYLRLGKISPYRISHKGNKFTAVGCNTFATLYDPYDLSVSVSGCISFCTNESNFINNSTCSGVGCCETAIPQGLRFYNITFNRLFRKESIDYSRHCSFAFLAEDGFYSFLKSDTESTNLYYRLNRKVPVVLDWVLGDEACEEAKLNKSGNYACVSLNSICKDSQNGPGYTCTCSQGYEGNPYIHDGCTDVDECKTHTMPSPCYGDCYNIPGSYQCLCPKGTYGNASIEGNCTPPSSHKLTTTQIVAIITASLSTLLVAAIVYFIHGKTKLNRAREKCFRQNGGLLLQAQINAHESVRFRIFSLKEILKATNNFDEGSIKGRGGQGIVYEGIIDCRQVAVKKAVMANEKRMKEFVKEMHILSLINHKNVVQILGCCLEVEVPILVYEFISGGTLYQRIQQRNQRMSLGYRLRIAIDSASALTYLHYDSLPPVIHGDIKSSNILLDENNIAKISDFGASMLPLKEINETGVPGTYGYLDPESLLTGQLTKKSDVYSFAVVFLELLTRMKAVYFDALREKRNLVETFKQEGLEWILDDEIKYVITKEQITEFSELLNNCLAKKGSQRPTMKKVLAWLRRIQEFDPKLSEESEYDEAEPVHVESSNHDPCTTLYYSAGHPVVFELDCNLTR